MDSTYATTSTTAPFSDAAFSDAAATGTAYSGAVPARPAKNPVGTVGLGFAIAGLVAGLIPFVCFFAWFLSLPALVLGIVGVTRKNKPRRGAAWAIGLAVAGWAASLVMSYVTFEVFGTIDVSAGA